MDFLAAHALAELSNYRGGRGRQMDLVTPKSFSTSAAATSQLRLAGSKSLPIRWAIGFDPVRA